MAEPGNDVGRRQVLRGLGGLGGLAVAAPVLAESRSAAALVTTPDEAGAPAPEQLHLQFGADAGHEMAVSWAAPQRVRRPVVRLGRPGHGLGTRVHAEERVYTEALTGEQVFTYHAVLPRLHADSRYEYQVEHRGAAPLAGSFRTAPAGRSRGFRFTSFGDQAVPAKVGQGLGPATPNAGYIVDAVDRLDPLFHLLNGDLCYANLSDEPVETWRSFFANNQRSASRRPWMPCAGNHENEVGNGPEGYLSYQTRFTLPGNGSKEFAGNWYSFTVGPIRVISLNNDDVCLQDGAFSAYRRDNVDGYQAKGYDPYEHHFERTFPVKGVLAGSSLLTPAPRGSDASVIDTTKGAVHMIIGGGGHSSATPPSAFDDPHDGVLIYDVGPGDPRNARPSLTTTEPAPWSAYRDLQRPYGFASFDFEPHVTGGHTQIAVTHYGAGLGSRHYTELDRFVMRKPAGHHH